SQKSMHNLISAWNREKRICSIEKNGLVWVQRNQNSSSPLLALVYHISHLNSGQGAESCPLFALAALIACSSKLSIVKLAEMPAIVILTLSEPFFPSSRLSPETIVYVPSPLSVYFAFLPANSLTAFTFHSAKVSFASEA